MPMNQDRCVFEFNSFWKGQTEKQLQPQKKPGWVFLTLFRGRAAFLASQFFSEFIFMINNEIKQLKIIGCSSISI